MQVIHTYTTMELALSVVYPLIAHFTWEHQWTLTECVHICERIQCESFVRLSARRCLRLSVSHTKAPLLKRFSLPGATCLSNTCICFLFGVWIVEFSPLDKPNYSWSRTVELPLNTIKLNGIQTMAAASAAQCHSL